MRRPAIAMTLTLLALSALALAPAMATAAPDRTYQKYAKVRDRVKACALDRSWNHLGSERRKKCSKLRRQYILFGRYGIPNTTFIACKTRKCPPRPIGVPDPRRGVPRGYVRIYG